MNKKVELQMIPSTELNPACIVYLLDMSGSMAEEITFNGSQMRKSDVVALNTNMCLNDIIMMCRRGDVYKDYVYVMALGYNGHGVTSLLDNYASQSPFCSIKDLVNASVDTVTYNSTFISGDVELSNNHKIKEFIKIDPYDNTPMYSCFKEAYDFISHWCSDKGRNSVPPFVINITDGEYTDASDSDMLSIAEKIKSTKTTNGNTLLFNIHVTSHSNKNSIDFPSSIKQIEDIKFAKQLFEMSSTIPNSIKHEVSLIAGRKECATMKGMVYNLSVNSLLDIMQIGSISINR